MTKHSNLSAGAKAYVAVVVLAGIAACVTLLATADLARWDWRPLAVFTVLGALSTAVSVSYQGYKPSITVHQIGTSFAYALFLLVDHGAVGLSLTLISAADWRLNRRRLAPGLFNIAQLWLSLGVAVVVRAAVDPHFRTTDLRDPRAIAASVASLVAFFAVNHVLTHGIISLASRSSFLRLDLGARIGVLNEFLCIVSGLGTAVFWSLRPALAILGIIPVWILALLVLMLSRREQALEARQDELRSLQEIGLEIGSELDVNRLREAVVRVVSEALQGAGGALAAVDVERKKLTLLCHRGVNPTPPVELPLSEATEAAVAAGRIDLVEDYVPLPDRYPELAVLGASGLLCAPLQARDRRDAMLVVFRDGDRRPFDEGDVRRLETLVRFVEMALSNARLVVDLTQIQAQLVHTEKMSALGMLVSGVAHEVNNPLTSVVGYTQLLMSQERDPAKRRMLEKAASEASRAGKIVQNLLSFSRKQKSERRVTDINNVLDMVLDLHAYELRVRDVEVVRRLAADVPPVVADRDQMQQVFLNLLTNAEHAVRDAGRRGRIVVESRLVGNRVRVTISDNGTGIAPDHLEKIFLPFFTTKELGRGTGLGLSICYGIVQDHGGSLEASSRVGDGATFVVELPAAEVIAVEAVLQPPAEAGPAAMPAAGRLLVVDDEAIIADLVRDILEPEGWSVDVARDGLEALEIVADHDFDVLLVDMRMPGMDGKSFFERLLSSNPEAAGRVIFATGDTGSEGTSQFLEDTGNPVLRKPYNLRNLVETVSRVASGSGGAAA